ncbi:MAG: hypothetical protein KDG50_10240 [Chromatiales bacterium]|nr:hypothetical protein [Chromatiales bacterium]
MGKQFDKRMHFITLALNQKLTTSPMVAHTWYTLNGAKSIPNEQAIQRFKNWIENPPKGEAA